MADRIDIAEYLEPLTFQVSLPCSVGQAFDAFTARIGDWWPLATHSVGQNRARSCRLEGRLGGRLIETSVDGSESTWAEVTVWEPPHLLGLHWHPGQPEAAGQAVEVRFVAITGGTRVELVHRDWHRTAEGERRRQAYRSGWQGLLQRNFMAWVEANERRWTVDRHSHG